MIEANDQRWAAVRIFEVLAQTIEQEVDKRGREERPGQATEIIEEVHKIAAKKRGKRSRVNGGHLEAEVANA